VNHLLPIPKEYLLDNFNLVQLAPVVQTIALLEYQHYHQQEQEQHQQHQQQQHQHQQQQHRKDQQEVVQVESDVSSTTSTTSATSTPMVSSTMQFLPSQPQKTTTTTTTTTTGIELFRRALHLITADDDDDFSLMNDSSNDDDSSEDNDQPLVELAAQILYIHIHQRYVVSPRGLEALRRRFLLAACENLIDASSDDNVNGYAMHGDNNNKQLHVQPIFGQCPRRSCSGFALLPTAGSDHYQMKTGNRRRHEPWSESQSTNDPSRRTRTTIPLLRYCASCGEIWNFYQTNDSSSSSSTTTTTTTPRRVSCSLDWNCAWGTSLAPLFLLTFPNFLSSSNAAAAAADKQEGMPAAAPLAQNGDDDELRIFGFPLHPATKSSLCISTI
jgi:Casein kinase II regulatory subunit